MDYRQIKRNINLDKLNSSEIFYPENFSSIKEHGYKLIDSLDFDGAVLFAGKLEKKLSEIKQLNENEKYFYDILSFWVNRLKVFAFGSLAISEQTILLKTQVVEIFSNFLDLKTAVFNFIDVFETEEVITDMTKGLILALGSSEDVLGKNKKDFQEKGFKPTVGNWIKEYQSVLSPVQGTKLKPVAFHIVKFMDTNTFVRFLSTEEKVTLRELLDFYNWLLSPIIYAEETISEKQTSYVNKQKFKLPENIQPVVSPPNITKPVTPPVVPKVKPVNLAEVMKNKDKIDLGVGSGIRFGGAGGSIQDTVNSKQNTIDSRQQTVNSKQTVIGNKEISNSISPHPPLDYRSGHSLPQGRGENEKSKVDIEKKLEDLKKRKKPQIS